MATDNCLIAQEELNSMKHPLLAELALRAETTLVLDNHLALQLQYLISSTSR